MIVIKFGGTSLANAENIRKVKNILLHRKENFIVVVSALGGVTNDLESLAKSSINEYPSPIFESLKERHLNTAHELIAEGTNPNQVQNKIEAMFEELNKLCVGVNTLGELSDKTLARFLSFGERLSFEIVGAYLSLEIPLNQIHSWELIKAEEDYLEGSWQKEISIQNIQNVLVKDTNYITPGYLASDSKDDMVLLGRGGSDFTASIFGVAAEADRIELWSDVDGMLETDPRVVEHSRLIENLTYAEALELAHFGAKVLHARAVRPAYDAGIPVLLKNTFNPKRKGTLITEEYIEADARVKGLSALTNISLLTLSGPALAGSRGTAKRFFGALQEVNIILISQSSSEQDICIAISTEQAELAKKVVEDEFEPEMLKNNLDRVTLKNGYSIIALVGEQMQHRPGLSGLAFSALGENGINVTAIAQGATERNISIVIDERNIKKALNVLHERFFLDTYKCLHLFVAGVGNVGHEFLKILRDQEQTLKSQHHLEIKVVGIANSKSYLIEENGLDLSDINALKAEMKPGNLDKFAEEATNLNLRNAFFVDNTASEVVSKKYNYFLSNSFHVVTCNKIASSSPMDNYQLLKKTAKEKNVQFRYETCVGAALPIIKTIQHLVLSGDRITKIQAVLSGSLNFIFNQYQAQSPFADAVKAAQEEGFTEPNPMIDLSGVDVMRKILILARESGENLEMDQVVNQNFLPENCSAAKNNDELFSILLDEEEYFQNLYNSAASKNYKLKVVATYEDGKTSVGLEEIPPESPFYHLEGKDNIVSINTLRYPQEPLVVKGAGAGAAVTASGVFSDILLIANK